ncbi:MAG: ABC transporter permease, partial [Bradyrhizobiaceae bacterium]|nr:ABC transporter permease [Bradyrhizobiaceae bacterium]
STITHEKARDIAIMKSLGFTERRVRAIFVIEAGLIGLVGALIGFALGYALCAALGTITFKNPLTDVTRLPIAYEPIHYALAAAVAIVSSLAAGYLPARKAASLHPVDIIRGAT